MMQHALALLLALGGLFAAGAGADPLPPMIDAHAHYSSPDAAAFTPAAVIARLDAAGVRQLVVTSSPPQLAQQLHQHAPDRVIPLLGVYSSDLHKGNWAHDAGLPARVAAQLDDGVGPASASCTCLPAMRGSRCLHNWCGWPRQASWS